VANLLFPALLKYWRACRGVSQLELALEAQVSARHVSFLESGRAQPSEDMVLRLMAVLGVPLRNQNEALRAAGLPPRFAEPPFSELSPEVAGALQQMMDQHEPYPLTVLCPGATIVQMNRGASALFRAFSAEPERTPEPPDMLSLLFDPRLMRPFTLEWDTLARSVISRLHRAYLASGGDARIHAGLERAFAFEGVPRGWKVPDFAKPTEPTLTVRLQRGDLRVAFLVTATVFSAPQQVTLDELLIESSFPLDAETSAVCAALAAR
jgi:transcriptional regulator with XRE-family HTH domain